MTIHIKALFPEVRFLVDYANPQVLFVEQHKSGTDEAFIAQYPEAQVLYFSGETTSFARYSVLLNLLYTLLFRLPCYPFYFFSKHPAAFVYRYLRPIARLQHWLFYQLVLRPHRLATNIQYNQYCPHKHIKEKLDRFPPRVKALLTEDFPGDENPNHLNYPFGLWGATHHQHMEQAPATDFAQRKFCVALVSNISKYNLLRIQYAISQYQNVDCFGAIHHATHGRFRNLWLDAYMCMQGYRFVICVDNTIKNYYTTEKLPLALYANTIPIYFGAPNVGDFFNIERMVYVPAFPSLKAVVQEVRRLNNDPKAYAEKLAQPAQTAQNKANEAALNKKFKQLLTDVFPKP